MSMITENGTGIAGANSYSTVAAADGYHELRANAAWAAALAPAKIAALVRATDYIEATYRAGSGPANSAQGLQWPSEGATALPTPLVAATHLLALYALAGPLTAPAERGIKSTKESALNGLASEETVYDDATPSDPYPGVTTMLAGLASLRGASTGSVRIGRLVR